MVETNMHVRWSAEALADQESIVEYLLPRSPEKAGKLLERFKEVSGILAKNPFIGRIGTDNTREWSAVRPYIIIYEVDEPNGIVLVLRIWHSSQNRHQLQYRYL